MQANVEHPISHLAKDTLWAGISLVGRMLLQGVYLVMLARALGPAGLGVYASAIALIGIFVPFSGWGASTLVLKYVSRDRRTARVSFCSAMVVLAASAMVLSLAAIGSGRIVFAAEFHWPLFASLAVAELLLLRFVEIVAVTFQAIDRLDVMARVHLTTWIMRVIAAAIYVACSGGPSAEGFAICYLAISSVAAAVCAWQVSRVLPPNGQSSVSRSAISEVLREGFPYALSLSATSVYVDIDKTMLARFATVDVTGFYTVAYRAVALAFVPAQALVSAIQTRLFRKGVDGIRVTARYSLGVGPYLGAYGAVAGVALCLTAPLIPMVLGSQFAGSVTVVRWLAFLPLIQACHYLLGDTLMSSGMQTARCACQVGTALLNVTLNIWLIPRMSWKGAVIATHVSEGLLALSLAAIVLHHSRLEKQVSSTPLANLDLQNAELVL